ncbi:MAG: thiamine phosphate synthase [Hyphococcus sp.]|nr:MAG: thiamine phosphate synthase [Marinicaulis sp.]
MRTAKLAAAARSLKHSSGASGAAFCLAFMTDQARAPHPEIIARAMPRGSAVILRDYKRPDKSALARRLRSITEKNGSLLLIGADARLAQEIGADGVHYPSWAAVKPDNKGAIITAACHKAEDLMRAKDAGANLAFLSPVFATGSHPGADALGAERFKALAAASPLPVIALGGVDETNASTLRGKNVIGLAAISAFL